MDSATLMRTLIALWLIFTSAVTTTALAWDSSEPPTVHAHSHNDYDQDIPLYKALENRFYSVEADVFLLNGEVWISHMGFAWQWKGRLKDMYLDPLQKLVDQNGSVYGDGRPFYLWIDLKEGSQELREALRMLLSNYKMFTIFTNKTEIHRPVTAILTGSNSKIKYIDAYLMKRACRDSNYFDPRDPPADLGWQWYAVNWADFFDWDGHGHIPQGQSDQFSALVRAMRAKGRKIRFWNAPDTEEYWALAMQNQIDLISTNRIAELRQFLDRYRH